MTTSKLAAEDEIACREAQHLTERYYNAIDRARNKVYFLYVDSATLLWNGNLVEGVENIARFWESVPATDHSVSSLNCQMGSEEVNGCRPIIVLSVGTAVVGALTHAFSQTLVLVTDDGKYKIFSDRFRYID
ncbi:NTF2-related export protein [Toxocara canis]|nr:NTF2-related export protein [Toxocara canis]